MKKKICVFEKKYGKSKGWFLRCGKEILSGPWKTLDQGIEAKKEWI